MRFAFILFVAMLLVGPAAADETGAVDKVPSAAADPRIAEQLDELDYRYEVDADGDYRLTFGLDDDRSQLAYVISATERYGRHRVREIWAPAYRAEGEQFPAEIANRLLEDAQSSKLGGWVKHGNTAMYVVKIAADASTEELDDGIDFAIRAADQMEAELSGDTDEF